jgi:hypothetical protein
MMNHIFRAIALPGSPILDLLGIEPEEKCTHMEEQRLVNGELTSRAQMTIDWLEKNIQTRKAAGEAIDMLQAVMEVTGRVPIERDIVRHQYQKLMNPENPNGHVAKFGIPVGECHTCCDFLDLTLLRQLRRESSMDKATFRKIKARHRVMNARLRKDTRNVT